MADRLRSQLLPRRQVVPQVRLAAVSHLSIRFYHRFCNGLPSVRSGFTTVYQWLAAVLPRSTTGAPSLAAKNFPAKIRRLRASGELTYIYIYIYIYTYIHIHVYIYIYIYIFVSIWVLVSEDIICNVAQTLCIYIYIYIICIYIYIKHT